MSWVMRDEGLRREGMTVRRTFVGFFGMGFFVFVEENGRGEERGGMEEIPSGFSGIVLLSSLARMHGSYRKDGEAFEGKTYRESCMRMCKWKVGERERGEKGWLGFCPYLSLCFSLFNSKS